MSRIDGQRCQHRKHVRLKERRHALHFIGREFGHPHEADTMRFEGRQQLLVQCSTTTFKQFPDARSRRDELVGGGQRVGLILWRTGCHLAPQASETNHVELIEVRTEDGQKLQPFQQRNARIQCFFENARIEFEPTQLAVQIRQRQRRQRGHSESGKWDAARLAVGQR